MSHLEPCDLLAIGPHPDDVEIGCAGTILLAAARGCRVAVLDLTRGEMATAGSADERAREAAAAAVQLGLAARGNLGLPDTQVQVDAASIDLLVGALRSARPRVVLAPHCDDVHPDHVATAELVSRAWFLAGLAKHRPELGPAHRPKLLLRYPGNRMPTPSLCIDISAVATQKDAVVACYRSQLTPPDRSHLLLGLDVRERALVRDRFFGAQIGVAAAEAFLHNGPLPALNLAILGL